jgi:hypothetical protein
VLWRWTSIFVKASTLGKMNIGFVTLDILKVDALALVLKNLNCQELTWVYR